MAEDFQIKKTKDKGKWCIYFPNVGEVYNTTYKKGVIKEFAKLRDDPIKVAPRVRVEIDGNKSDFIPIFFKPKQQYWDTDAERTTQLNEVQKYYETSWQSFRCDDEVIVQCYKNQPAAVVGFYDGIPRIGESLIKIEASTVQTSTLAQVFLHSAKQDFYKSEQEVGPDGEPLKLLKNCELIYQEESTKTLTYYLNHEGDPDYKPEWWEYSIDYCETSSHAWSEVGDSIAGEKSYNPLGGFTQGFSQGTRIGSTTTVVRRYPKVKFKYVGRTHHYLCVVGPILYVIQILSMVEPEKNPSFADYDKISNSSSYEGKWSYDQVMVILGFPPAWGEPDIVWTFENPQIAVNAEWVDATNKYFERVQERDCQIQEEGEKMVRSLYKCDDPWEARGKIVLVEIAAGVYTKKLYDQVKGAAKANYKSSQFFGYLEDIEKGLDEFYTEYPGLIRQVKWVKSLDAANEGVFSGFPTYQWQYQWGNEIPVDGIDMGTAKVYVRPHTKTDIENLLGKKNG